MGVDVETITPGDGKLRSDPTNSTLVRADRFKRNFVVFHCRQDIPEEWSDCNCSLCWYVTACQECILDMKLEGVGRLSILKFDRSKGMQRGRGWEQY